MPVPWQQKFGTMLSRKTQEGKQNDMVDMAFHNKAEKNKKFWVADFIGHVAVEHSHGTPLHTSIRKALNYYPSKFIK